MRKLSQKAFDFLGCLAADDAITSLPEDVIDTEDGKSESVKEFRLGREEDAAALRELAAALMDDTFCPVCEVEGIYCECK